MFRCVFIVFRGTDVEITCSPVSHEVWGMCTGQCKVAVGFETDEVQIVHMTAFSVSQEQEVWT